MKTLELEAVSKKQIKKLVGQFVSILLLLYRPGCVANGSVVARAERAPDDATLKRMHLLPVTDRSDGILWCFYMLADRKQILKWAELDWVGAIYVGGIHHVRHRK